MKVPIASEPAPPAAAASDAEKTAALVTAAYAVIDAFGGDWPDWLRAELEALNNAAGDARK